MTVGTAAGAMGLLTLHPWRRLVGPAFWKGQNMSKARKRGPRADPPHFESRPAAGVEPDVEVAMNRTAFRECCKDAVAAHERSGLLEQVKAQARRVEQDHHDALYVSFNAPPIAKTARALRLRSESAKKHVAKMAERLGVATDDPDLNKLVASIWAVGVLSERLRVMPYGKVVRAAKRDDRLIEWRDVAVRVSDAEAKLLKSFDGRDRLSIPPDRWGRTRKALVQLNERLADAGSRFKITSESPHIQIEER